MVAPAVGRVPIRIARRDCLHDRRARRQARVVARDSRRNVRHRRASVQDEALGVQPAVAGNCAHRLIVNQHAVTQAKKAASTVSDISLSAVKYAILGIGIAVSVVHTQGITGGASGNTPATVQIQIIILSRKRISTKKSIIVCTRHHHFRIEHPQRCRRFSGNNIPMHQTDSTIIRRCSAAMTVNHHSASILVHDAILHPGMARVFNFQIVTDHIRQDCSSSPVNVDAGRPAGLYADAHVFQEHTTCRYVEHLFVVGDGGDNRLAPPLPDNADSFGDVNIVRRRVRARSKNKCITRRRRSNRRLDVGARRHVPNIARGPLVVASCVHQRVRVRLRS